MRITLVAGARPNFMKIAPLIYTIESQGGKDHSYGYWNDSIDYRLVHTGQHYDNNMSGTFFSDLNIPEPDVNLGAGGGTQAEQTAAIMIAFEKDLQSHPTDLVIVVGDVTSTMACSIVAKKLNTKVAHVEAGIRSFDMTMPEEINRMVTDTLTDYFFATTQLAVNNLKNNGVPDEKIFLVGNVMIDTLLANRHRFRKPGIWDEASLRKGNFIVLTLHRPNNVDIKTQLRSLLEAINEYSRGVRIVFPVHPRTARMIRDLKLTVPKSFIFTDPLGYLEFNYLVENCMAVITDSGGITEETTVMGIPCITLRDSTERPETISIGTNELIGTDPQALKPVMEKLFNEEWKKGDIPELWDGKSSERIISHLKRIYGQNKNPDSIR
jgi:UDP-N-acetylglucosamine 2-epimerase (non-hydrolysing)